MCTIHDPVIKTKYFSMNIPLMGTNDKYLTFPVAAAAVAD